MKPVNSAKNQYLATFFLNLLAISYGSSSGWMSPSIPILQSENSPLPSGPISTEEGAWIGATLCLGGVVGNIVSGWMADRYGRKWTAYIAVIPQIVSWILVIVADNVYYLIAMRFLSGFGGGVCYMINPMFIAEIAEDRIRGLLGSTLVFSSNLGLLVMYILGASVPYHIVPYVLITVPVVFLIGFISVPDTPFHYMRQNKYQSSESSLKFYRGYSSERELVSVEFQQELLRLKDYCGDEKQVAHKNQITWKDLSTPHARKAFLIGICLMAFNQFCGCFAMLNYTATIFADSGSTLSANMSAIVTGSLQMVGSYCSTLLVERAGRKPLLILSGTGMAIGLTIFSGYSYAKALGYDVDSFRWLPLVCFSFVIFIASIGVLPLPFLVLAELVPQKTKELIFSTCMSISWLFAFISVKYVATLFGLLGIHGTMMLFAACSMSGVLFVAFMVPETKGKSFDVIAKMMS
ncbi:facilitated trehalose transporter Tret1-2 homolog [Aedes albopictus]|uniref:Major facilitator superfamily (MFS) profile domain-containing protein n=1 Tax=Aedes albopictus TaxID=7160 RepID=A0ABM1ZL84_AEDAL